ncbi:MAG: glycoside hydrolase family 18 protein [Romboutsia sp.]
MQNKYQVMAYLKDKDKWGKEDIDASKLTCINYSFAKVKDCKAIETFTKIHILKELKEENPHLKTCLSIGGWGADGFSDAVLTKESRVMFIESIYEMMNKYDFDGVDLDWEYPGLGYSGIVARKEDNENFLLFVKELRLYLDTKALQVNRDFWLTAAIGASDTVIDAMLTKNGAEYTNYLDYVHIMTYDMRNGYKTGHHANLYTYENAERPTSADRSVRRLIDQGVPKEKIVIGGAFYSRVWEGITCSENPLNIDSKNPGLKVVDYNFLEDFKNEHNLKYYWDDEAKAPYLYNGDIFVSYDDEKSLSEKVKYVKENEIGGIMFWEYSLDLSLKLLSAIDDEMNKSEIEN